MDNNPKINNKINRGVIYMLTNNNLNDYYCGNNLEDRRKGQFKNSYGTEGKYECGKGGYRKIMGASDEIISYEKINSVINGKSDTSKNPDQDCIEISPKYKLWLEEHSNKNQEIVE